MFGEEAFAMADVKLVNTFSARELAALKKMLAGEINSPITSSMGRLFDAVAAIIGLRYEIQFEGQAAMELEFAIQEDVHETYPFRITGDSPSIVDWAPMILEILIDLQKEQSSGWISAKFHNTLVEVILAVARKVGEPKILLTGGCFQNRYLVERSVQRLSEKGFTPYWHQRVPPNDGGIALGQVVAAARSRSVIASLGKNAVPKLFDHFGKHHPDQGFIFDQEYGCFPEHFSGRLWSYRKRLCSSRKPLAHLVHRPMIRFFTSVAKSRRRG